MADEPLTAQELRALAANAQIVEAELAAARVALADAGAREAELVDVLWRALAAVMAHGKDGGCQDCINVAKAIEAVVASPSAAADGFRLAKALADAVVYVPAKGVRCPVCEEYPTVIGANCVEEYHRSYCELDAYNTHEEASRGA